MEAIVDTIIKPAIGLVGDVFVDLWARSVGPAAIIWAQRAYILLSSHREMIQMYIHLILAALFPIYIGAHAALRRPTSAATPEKSEEEEADDGGIEEPAIEGLQPSDAIMFPVLAGITLGGLYLLIKWLDDPALLNKILGYYFSLLGVFGVGKLAADAIGVGTTFIFPSVWSSNMRTYYVEPLLSLQVTGAARGTRTVRIRGRHLGKTNPFPGYLSRVKFSEANTRRLWSLRALLKNHWIFRGYVHNIFSVKSRVKVQDVTGFLIGIVAIALYNSYGKVWWLTNLIGFGFCYGTLQIMSPTTFWTGTLVLCGLFIYDITMVFYTPLMVTVATTLDVPIKLVFPGPKKGSMLGLGDVVLPGIMMALALRYDLYLHYLRKQTTSPKSPGKITKAEYIDANGSWGERFWTWGRRNVHDDQLVHGARFSKVYFKASLAGYIVGLITTLVVLIIFDHAQPALLYLVPGVLISLWGTAFVRGEVKLMWEYTEDSGNPDDKKDEKKPEKIEHNPVIKDDEKGGEQAAAKSENPTTSPDAPTPALSDTNSESSFGSGFTEGDDGAHNDGIPAASMPTVRRIVDTDDHSESDKEADKEKDKDDESGWEDVKEDHSQHVFLFSLSSPKRAAKKASLFKGQIRGR